MDVASGGGSLTGRPKDKPITRSSRSRLPSLPRTVTTMRGLDLHLLHSLAPLMVPLVPLWPDFLWAWPTRNYDSMTPIGPEWGWTRWWILRRGPNSEHCVTARVLPALVMLLPRLPSSASLLRRRCPSLPLCRDRTARRRADGLQGPGIRYFLVRGTGFFCEREREEDLVR
jgi:hypothetical protein